ncbi:gliding motility-associated ABC transporter ATP-binding subunit GldA [Aureibacter tunicatorum]|uniref:ABC-2 type transport system ATP-binding protein n=1 Tax=Aureibacter tunicatorum TaxID=866807 RepID=A0AAE3XTA4_9BACT|nr:gliding motility-associated ABC transporter ATP-binding subunit GldA [Aureibacter tunicatorum]MDR6241249.1 ABC-2 type transport system ATP-binding protein [Aureibacter tunicatorum]BDD03509.1 gliding motility-associated ABC transporter ATP-binding subunit GldA [Aureibacter tunicatorum]
MSIEINKLTKIYGNQIAVDSISFSAQKGEIIGLLGPNGAGKSTTMKILTGFLSPTHGETHVCGINVQEETIKAQQKIGYLPENNPLHYEMYVKEYLNFAANLYNIKKPKERIAEIIDLCGLTPECHKKIGQLSKGYKQRVGLAQALIHNPEVLILDEPTTGLDPNQLVDIRSLIKKISQDKTVILSTHIMQEVEAICSRVVIFNKGKLITDKPIAEIQTDMNNANYVYAEFSESINTDIFIENGLSFQSQEANTYRFSTNNETETRKAIFNLATKNNLPLIGLWKEKNKLEDIFHDLTGKKQ